MTADKHPLGENGFKKQLGGKRKYVMVRLKRETKIVLDELKKLFDKRSYDEVIKELITALRLYEEMRLKQFIHELMCNELEDASFSLPALVKIIQKKEEELGFKATVFTEHAIISQALSYIAPIGENMYKVRKDMCQ